MLACIQSEAMLACMKVKSHDDSQTLLHTTVIHDKLAISYLDEEVERYAKPLACILHSCGVITGDNEHRRVGL